MLVWVEIGKNMLTFTVLIMCVLALRLIHIHKDLLEDIDNLWEYVHNIRQHLFSTLCGSL